MARKRKILKAGTIVLGVVFIGIWIAGEAMIRRTNPPERYTGVILSAEADPVLKRACFDCHSNETRYPAYSYLPIASLLLANHVREGRQEMNLSLWDRVGPKDRAEFIEDSLEEVRGERMPTPDYRLMHPDARLSAADISLIGKAAADVYGVKAGSGKAKKGEGRERQRGERGDKR